MLVRVFLAACLASASLTRTPAAAQSLTSDQKDRIGEVFADLNAPGSPGATVAVIREGRLIHSAGFGEAQIEHGVPITPTTVFHVASVSKQFTAMGILLLEEDGKLSLDDDVRKHIPEVPDMGETVTIRHLLHHTSGVRDQWELLAMAGWRLDDVITKEHVRRLLGKQRELNFEPGSEYLYSNMGYSLAADIVERVSGQPFSEFLHDRVFEPLDMSSTHVHDDHRHVVPDRAYSYASEGESFENRVLSYANHGATSLFTTAEDLTRWLDNFRHERIGGSGALSRMTTRGILNNGDTIGYALGVGVGSYRGAATVGHGGADAGFRSSVMWFPEHDTGIAVLSNLASANPGRRARQVADIVLGEALEPVAERPGGQNTGPRRQRDAESTSREALVEFAGRYYSPEIETIYEMRLGRDGLEVYHLRHGTMPIQARGDDTFAGNTFRFREARFTRDGSGEVDGFRLTGSRVRNLRFVRLRGDLPR